MWSKDTCIYASQVQKNYTKILTHYIKSISHTIHIEKKVII